MFKFEQQLQSLYVDGDENINVSRGLYIMTIHKAKGLEFDIVIIPGLDRRPRQDGSQLLMWMERPSKNQHESELILAPIKPVDQPFDPIYRYLAYENKKKNHYETDVCYMLQLPGQTGAAFARLCWHRTSTRIAARTAVVEFC